MKRLNQLLSLMDKHKFDAFLVSSWPNVSYISGFTGTESWLLISRRGLYFITDGRYDEQARQETKGYKIILRGQKSVAGLTADICRKYKFRSLAFESHIITHQFFTGLVNVFKSTQIQLLPSHGLIESLRLSKDRSEVSLIRESARIAVEGFHYVKDRTRPGMSELQLQGALEHYTKSIGSQKPAFDIIIAAGKGSSMPHYVTGDRIVKDNDQVLVDMGVVYKGYHSDLTRPIFLGRMSPLQKKIRDIVWKAQRLGIKAAKPGALCSDVDRACRDYIRKMGYDKYFSHSTGHGVGLEIHEAPWVSSKSTTVLKPGMVITVEPGIYLPGKFGVRIEDMVLITQSGNEVLTSGLDERI